jgi:hypothetical protein
MHVLITLYIGSGIADAACLSISTQATLTTAVTINSFCFGEGLAID